MQSAKSGPTPEPGVIATETQYLGGEEDMSQ
jgi:hypothetical protein